MKFEHKGWQCLHYLKNCVIFDFLNYEIHHGFFTWIFRLYFQAHIHVYFAIILLVIVYIF